jgi:ParB family chromosome partitioning protein
MEVTNLTQDQVAERVGKSRSAVANALRLLNLPQAAMESVRSGTMSAGHARAVLSVLNPADRSALMARIVDEGISVREAEAAASEFNKGKGGAKIKAGVPAKPSPKPMDPDLARLEQDLIGKLGTKVSIKGESGRGTIVIEYFSMDDLDRVYGIIARDGT